MIEAPGLLDDPDDDGSLVATLTAAELAAREAAVSGRIKRKLLALKSTCRDGRTRVIIADGRIDRPVSAALAGGGTHIR